MCIVGINTAYLHLMAANAKYKLQQPILACTLGFRLLPVTEACLAGWLSRWP